MNCIILPSNLIYLYQLWILTYGWFISPFLIFHTLPRRGTKKLVKLSADKGLSSLVWNDGIEETKIMTWQEFQPIGIWKLGGVGWWLTSSGIELWNPTIYSIICWFAWPMGQTTHQPSIWCSEYFLFIISYRLRAI